MVGTVKSEITIIICERRGMLLVVGALFGRYRGNYKSDLEIRNIVSVVCHHYGVLTQKGFGHLCLAVVCMELCFHPLCS